jgi:hypothetical protein
MGHIERSLPITPEQRAAADVRRRTRLSAGLGGSE